MNDAFIAFCCGLLCGMIVGVFIFAVVITIKAGEFKRDEHGRQIFGGRCPYTDKECKTWACGTCKVARAERQYNGGET